MNSPSLVVVLERPENMHLVTLHNNTEPLEDEVVVDADGIDVTTGGNALYDSPLDFSFPSSLSFLPESSSSAPDPLDEGAVMAAATCMMFRWPSHFSLHRDCEKNYTLLFGNSKGTGTPPIFRNRRFRVLPDYQFLQTNQRHVIIIQK